MVEHGVDKSLVYLSFPAYRRMYHGQTFEYEHTRLPYFVSHYNATWRNERIVELPVAEHFLRSVTGPGLEVGNVLGHYRPHGQRVIDLHERGRDVLNVDAVDYRPPAPLGWILMISTLEHIGWDEEPGAGPDARATRAADKLHRTVRNLRAALAPDGRMLVTAPRGYNPHLDAAIDAGSLAPARETFMSRAATRNRWWQESRSTALASRPFYDFQRRLAHSLWIAEFSSHGAQAPQAPTAGTGRATLS